MKTLTEGDVLCTLRFDAKTGKVFVSEENKVISRNGFKLGMQEFSAGGCRHHMKTVWPASSGLGLPDARPLSFNDDCGAFLYCRQEDIAPASKAFAEAYLRGVLVELETIEKVMTHMRQMAKKVKETNL